MSSMGEACGGETTTINRSEPGSRFRTNKLHPFGEIVKDFNGGL